MYDTIVDILEKSERTIKGYNDLVKSGYDVTHRGACKIIQQQQDLIEEYNMYKNGLIILTVNELDELQRKVIMMTELKTQRYCNNFMCLFYPILTDICICRKRIGKNYNIENDRYPIETIKKYRKLSNELKELQEEYVENNKRKSSIFNFFNKKKTENIDEYINKLNVITKKFNGIIGIEYITNKEFKYIFLSLLKLKATNAKYKDLPFAFTETINYFISKWIIDGSKRILELEGESTAIYRNE